MIQFSEMEPNEAQLIIRLMGDAIVAKDLRMKNLIKEGKEHTTEAHFTHEIIKLAQAAQQKLINEFEEQIGGQDNI